MYTLHNMLPEHIFLSSQISSISFWWTIFFLLLGIYSMLLLSAATLEWDNALEFLSMSTHWLHFHLSYTFTLPAYDGHHPTVNFYKMNCFRFRKHMVPHGTCLSMFNSFHALEWFPFPYVFLKMAGFHSFYGWLVFRCVYALHFLHPFISWYTRVVSISWLLWIEQEWAWGCSCLSDILI